MPVDFTVVITVRQRFGDQKEDRIDSLSQREFGLEASAPFVGAEKDFPFQCPGVDRSQPAILLFQSMGVTKAQVLEINGQVIHGGIPVSVDQDSRRLGSGSDAHTDKQMHARWNGNVMLIHPGVLALNNVLRIRAAEMTSGNIDDFIIDNAVVVFKTTARGIVATTGGLVATARSARPAKKTPKKSAKRRR
jgi:hypothetical protein